MSRIGRMPVALPAGVSIDVKEKEFTVKGPKGTLTQEYDPKIKITVEGAVAHLTRADDENETARNTVCTGRFCTTWSWALPKGSKRPS